MASEGPWSAEAAAEILGRLLISGRLNRIPRHPDQREVVLGILSVGLRRRHAYTEVEINDYLGPALEAMNARVDHVTCRRYLVDYGFLKRDRAGSRYFLNFPRLEQALSPEARSSATALIEAAMEAANKRQSDRSR
jgi:hypothetical protein